MKSIESSDMGLVENGYKEEYEKGEKGKVKELSERIFDEWEINEWKELREFIRIYGNSDGYVYGDGEYLNGIVLE